MNFIKRIKGYFNYYEKYKNIRKQLKETTARLDYAIKDKMALEKEISVLKEDLNKDTQAQQIEWKDMQIKDYIVKLQIANERVNSLLGKKK